MTTGVKNALSRGNVHSMCTECGFPLPKYPGRYPKDCPSCGAERKADTTNYQPSESDAVGASITIDDRTGTIVEATEDVYCVEWPDGTVEAVER